MACASYIERNPVCAGMVKMARKWKWSIANAHCGIYKADILKVNELSGHIEKEMRSFKGYIAQPDDPEKLRRIKECTVKGSPRKLKVSGAKMK